MAYTESWDESVPDGSVVSSEQIDEHINQTKRMVRERLETISSFGSDDDPMTLDEGTARITADTQANRPASPSLEGEAYFETDTEDLYIAVPDGSGGLEWARDAVDQEITAARISEYDDSLAAGSKETSSSSFNDIMAMFVSGTTDANGIITVDTGELAFNLDPGLIWAEEVIAVPGPNHADVISNVVYKNPGSSTFDLEFYGTTFNLYQSAAASATVWLPQI